MKNLKLSHKNTYISFLFTTFLLILFSLYYFLFKSNDGANLIELFPTYKTNPYETNDALNVYKAITIPQTGKYTNNPYFKFSGNISQNKGKCIDRTQFSKELSLLFNKHIDKSTLTKQHILIVGGMTTIGYALKEIFKERNISYVSVNGINEIDFSSEDSYKVLDTVNIKTAIITYQPPLIRHTFSDGSDYIRENTIGYVSGLIKYLKRKKIKFVFVLTQPIFDEVIKEIIDNNGLLIEIPYLVDSKAIKDLENPIIRAIRECKKVGYTNIEFLPFNIYQSITTQNVTEFVLKQLENNVTGYFSLRGVSTIDVPTAVKVTLNSLNIKNCQINYQTFPHKIQKSTIKYNHEEVFGDKNTDIISMLEDSYKNFQIKENPQKKFYCSIVVPGRNDKYGIGFENRLQNFLNAIEYGIKTVPLADVEVIFVDYATPIENPLLSDVINVSKTFTGKVRFIVVPPNAHRTLEERYQTKYGFLEYVAKNIGVRRSQGKIILTTNADCLFPTEFFELIAGHQFNTAVIYRGNRWNLNNTMLARNNITMNEFIKIISETWRLKNMELSEWCTDFTNRFAVIDSCDEYYKKECSCAPGDFQMLSKDMWHAMQGFNELPANYATDSVFIARIMKLIPGYMRMFVHPLFFHQNHEGKAKQNRFPKEKKVKKDYCCIGNCIACGPYYDCDDWGLAEYAFDEVKY